MIIISLSKLRYKYTRCDPYYSTPMPDAKILDTAATAIGSAAVDIANIIGSIVGKETDQTENNVDNFKHPIQKYM